MQIHHEFDQNAIDYFSKITGHRFDLTNEQILNLSDSGVTELVPQQMSDTVELLSPTQSLKEKFVINNFSEIGPVSFSLFLTNPDLWKMMEKKAEHKERMYPMMTVPWFYWARENVTRQNPFGVVRHELNDLRLSPFDSEKRFVFSGRAGNFCGLIESEIEEYRSKSRPIIIPSLPEKSTIIPNYEFTKFRVYLNLENITTKLYPEPKIEFDYSFSESPKLFYNQGLLIQSEGQAIRLSIGGISSLLRGDASLYFCCNPYQNPERVLLAHVWLWTLNSVLRNKSNT